MGLRKAIGMMSGTSLDGVDVALIETDGHSISAFGPAGYRPYADAERAVLRQALQEAVALTSRTARPGILAEAEALVTRTHAEAVEKFIADHRIDRASVAVVGFHGQTVLHRPQMKLTVQIGDADALAQRIGLPVAYDFRAADVAGGGQGAPLVPVYHCALVAALKGPQPVAVLNVGGVANVTYCDGEHPPVACDTGPGNALIDDFLRARTGQAFDDGGAMAARGTVNEAFVARVLSDKFFDQPPPKSLDRNAFAHASLSLPEMSVVDGCATLAMLTAASVARVVPHLPRPPARWIVAGGGARNKTLMNFLAAKLSPAMVQTADAAGWSSDALEAQAFAYLAVRTLDGLPITFPATTGVKTEMAGGLLVKPDMQGKARAALA
jgi:anhydro-N-acetylmuramic acid kinase